MSADEISLGAPGHAPLSKVVKYSSLSTPTTYGAAASVLVPLNVVRPAITTAVPCGAEAYLMPALPVRPPTPKITSTPVLIK